MKAALATSPLTRSITIVVSQQEQTISKFPVLTGRFCCGAVAVEGVAS